jgi:hypothetical protein
MGRSVETGSQFFVDFSKKGRKKRGEEERKEGRKERGNKIASVSCSYRLFHITNLSNKFLRHQKPVRGI